MGKGRLEAFSDGVIAIIITIMVLELRPPTGAGWQDLRPLIPTFLSYALSFAYVAIYWNNHHQLFRTARTISAHVMWANMNLLFWLSMIPFATAWMGEHHEETAPAALYGAVLLMAALAYFLLSRLMVRHEGADSAVAHAMGRTAWADRKGNLSLAIYVLGIAAASRWPHAAQALYLVVAMIWFVPDQRVDRALTADAR